jgi:hypothetical protein
MQEATLNEHRGPKELGAGGEQGAPHWALTMEAGADNASCCISM